MQSRISSVLAIGLMSVLGLGAPHLVLRQYAMTRQSRARSRARKALSTNRAQGDMPLPSLGRIDPTHDASRCGYRAAAPTCGSGLHRQFRWSPTTLREIPLEASPAAKAASYAATSAVKTAELIGAGARNCRGSSISASKHGFTGAAESGSGNDSRRPAQWCAAAGDAGEGVRDAGELGALLRPQRECGRPRAGACRHGGCSCPRARSSTARWKPPSIQRCPA